MSKKADCFSFSQYFPISLKIELKEVFEEDNNLSLSKCGQSSVSEENFGRISLTATARTTITTATITTSLKSTLG